MSPQSPKKDGASSNPLPFHYGWVVVAAAFLALSTYGVFYAYGVFQKPVTTDLGWTRDQFSLAFSVYMVVYTLSATPMGWLYDRWGPRVPLLIAAVLLGTGISLSSRVSALWQLYFLLGFVAAVGFGALWVVPVATTIKWFARRRGLVTGIATCGQGIGIFAMYLASQWLIDALGWRNAFLIIGLTFFAINLLAALVIRGSPGEMGLRPCGEPHNPAVGDVRQAVPGDPSPAANTRGLTIRQALQTRTFWLLYIGMSFLVGTDRLIAVHADAFATDMGVSPLLAAGAVGMIGIGGILGRIALGALSDAIGRKPTLSLCCAIETASVLALAGVTHAAPVYVLITLMGFAYGGFIALLGPLVGEFFGLENVGRMIGVFFSAGALAAVVPWLGGLVFRHTGSYDWAFVLAAGMCTAAFLFSLLARAPSPEFPSAEEA